MMDMRCVGLIDELLWERETERRQKREVEGGRRGGEEREIQRERERERESERERFSRVLYPRASVRDERQRERTADPPFQSWGGGADCA